MGRDSGQKTVHAIEKTGSLYELINNWLIAYRARTEAWKGSDEGSTNPDIGLIKEEVSIVHGMIFDLTRKVDEFMATQEERLQAILVAVKNVKQMLADLKNNNPAIEDEITAIEQELAPATEPAPTEPNP